VKNSTQKAWAVTNSHWPGSSEYAIYTGRTESEVKGKAASVLRDLGLTSKQAFGGLRTKRRPEYDGYSFPYGYSEDSAKRHVNALVALEEGE